MVQVLGVFAIIMALYVFMYLGGKYAAMMHLNEMYEKSLEDEKRTSTMMKAERDFYKKECEARLAEHNKLMNEYDSTNQKLSTENVRLQQKLSKAGSYATHLENTIKKIATQEQYQQLIKDSKKWQDSLSK